MMLTRENAEARILEAIDLGLEEVLNEFNALPSWEQDWTLRNGYPEPYHLAVTEQLVRWSPKSLLGIPTVREANLAAATVRRLEQQGCVESIHSGRIVLFTRLTDQGRDVLKRYVSALADV